MPLHTDERNILKRDALACAIKEAITIQGISGKLKSFKAIPASESESGWREINITVEIENNDSKQSGSGSQA